MVIDFATSWRLASVNVSRLVSHLCRGGKPALSGRINKRAGNQPGRIRWPNPETRVFVQTPRIFKAVAVRVIAFGDRAIHLHSREVHWQVIRRGYEVRHRAVDFDLHFRAANGVSHAVTRFRQVEELDFRRSDVSDLQLRRLADG